MSWVWFIITTLIISFFCWHTCLEFSLVDYKFTLHSSKNSLPIHAAQPVEIKIVFIWYLETTIVYSAQRMINQQLRIWNQREIERTQKKNEKAKLYLSIIFFLKKNFRCNICWCTNSRFRLRMKNR
jgi:hypothetical protein